MGIVRLLLAVSVVLFHATPPGEHQVFGSNGTISVQMFYAISGFYMALVLDTKYRGPASTGKFYLNRFLRLYPVYAVVVAITLLVAFALRACHRYAPPLLWWSIYWNQMGWGSRAFLLLVHITVIGQEASLWLGISPQTKSLYWTSRFQDAPLQPFKLMAVPQAWTLGLEFMFYAIAPLITRWRLSWIVLLFVLCIVPRHWLTGDPWNYRFFPTALPMFLAGVIAYKVYRNRHPSKWICVAALCGALTLVALYQRMPRFLLLDIDWQFFVFAPLIPLVFHISKRNAIDRWIGELSYPLYMIHMFCITLGASLSLRIAHQHPAAVAVLSSAILAVVLQRCVEQPVEMVRQRIAKLKQPAPTLSAIGSPFSTPGN